MFKPPLTGLAARKAAAETKLALAAKESGRAIIKAPSDMEHRIGIVFDDSGSMGYDGSATKPIDSAIAGVEEFLRSCTKDQTAVAIYPMNAAPLDLNSNLPAVAVYTKGLTATYGTPLMSTLKKMLVANNCTRAIVFSDGTPDSRTINMDKTVPVDTVFIGGEDDYTAIQFMKQLAEETGGIFLHFIPGKSNFAAAFKYLSPGLRFMLADKSFADKIQGK